MRHRLQMGTTGTSNARQADCLHKEIGGVWTLDEKMGQTYVHREQANTLAQRDYKQPQIVVYERTEDGNDSKKADTA